MLIKQGDALSRAMIFFVAHGTAEVWVTVNVEPEPAAPAAPAEPAATSTAAAEMAATPSFAAPAAPVAAVGGPGKDDAGAEAAKPQPPPPATGVAQRDGETPSGVAAAVPGEAGRRRNRIGSADSNKVMRRSSFAYGGRTTVTFLPN